MSDEKIYPVSAGLKTSAHIDEAKYNAMYRRSIDDPEGFWGEIAKELHWFEPWEKVLEWNPPYAKWFVGGKLNVSYNCLDRHLDGPRRDQVALLWEGEPGDTRSYTYAELHAEVSKFANALKGLGVVKKSKKHEVIQFAPAEWAKAKAILDASREKQVSDAESKGVPARAILKAMGVAGG